ncbi:hypothetical protein EDD11_006397 [Mortierella claussenii]|nr:hypothetical protein EDD11_006397 [Mortierella claussenii]
MPHIPIPIGVMPLVNANANAHINAVAVAAAAAAAAATAATAANGNLAVPIDTLTDATVTTMAPIPGLQALAMLALDADTEMAYLEEDNDEHSDATPIPFTPSSYVLHPMVIEAMDIDVEVGQEVQP